jgi:hypothetical protein
VEATAPAGTTALQGAAIRIGTGGSLGALAGGLFSKGDREPQQDRKE